MVDCAAGDRAARHAVVLGGSRVLRHRQSARGLDRSQTDRAVGAGTGDDDPDRVLLHIRGQGAQKEIDRHAYAAGPDRRGQPQGPLADAQVPGWRDAIDVIGLDRCVGLNLYHGHARAPPDQLRHEASVGRVQVLDEHERHAAGGGQRAEELRERVEAACRRAQAYDCTEHREGWFRGAPGGFLAGLRAGRACSSSRRSGLRDGLLLRAAPRTCCRTHPRAREKCEPSHRIACRPRCDGWQRGAGLVLSATTTVRAGWHRAIRAPAQGPSTVGRRRPGGARRAGR